MDVSRVKRKTSRNRVLFTAYQNVVNDRGLRGEWISNENIYLGILIRYNLSGHFKFEARDIGIAISKETNRLGINIHFSTPNNLGLF